jgi:hypothetical protein
LIVIKSDCKKGVSKSNHPIKNPLLLVTKPRTRDSIKGTYFLFFTYGLFDGAANISANNEMERMYKKGFVA